MVATIRYHMATTTHVADLYLTLWFLCIGDGLLVFIMGRLGFEEIPIIYLLMVGGAFVYELYILWFARRAYLARLKMKKV